MSSRARVLILNAALGPLDYRVPAGMSVEPGSIVVAPLGPRQLLGVVQQLLAAAFTALALGDTEIADAREIAR